MKTAKSLVTQQGLGTLQRPRFAPGLLLEDDDLTAAVTYTREMMRLMFRSLFGCGVVCGFEIEAKLICSRSQLQVTIAKGLALDCLGNPVQVPKSQTLIFNPDCKPLPPKIWVCVCHIEKCCGPRDISCSPDDDGQVVYTRAQEGFEIRLYGTPPECACSCAPPAPETPKQPCCDPHAALPATGAVAPPAPSAATFDYCECYKNHNDGKCACDCGCECVVIGTVDTAKPADPDKPDGDLLIDTGMVRRIRPVLTGFYLSCPKPSPTGDNDGGKKSDASAPDQHPM